MNEIKYLSIICSARENIYQYTRWATLVFYALSRFFARNLLRLYDSYMNVSLNLRLVKSKEFLKKPSKKVFLFSVIFYLIMRG